LLAWSHGRAVLASLAEGVPLCVFVCALRLCVVAGAFLVRAALFSHTSYN
jgi:hypothetical protein